VTRTVTRWLDTPIDTSKHPERHSCGKAHWHIHLGTSGHSLAQRWRPYPSIQGLVSLRTWKFESSLGQVLSIILKGIRAFLKSRKAFSLSFRSAGYNKSTTISERRSSATAVFKPIALHQGQLSHLAPGRILTHKVSLWACRSFFARFQFRIVVSTAIRPEQATPSQLYSHSRPISLSTVRYGNNVGDLHRW
jgi:hypothetical protein